MTTYTIKEIHLAMDKELIGRNQSTYILERLKSNNISKVLEGQLLDEQSMTYELAKLFVMGGLNQEEFIARLKPDSVDIVMLQVLEIKKT